ncbi:protein AUXIN RESPONSE 4 [Malania oleifera]|uniref:protein AUXIN RESPONSE 4 n=1 Tax=Malania oleifera TaxID=397392 RepID=UPI0025AEC175|nr:protein AUXIN RESPONSE 4 [Malania oleifera]
MAIITEEPDPKGAPERDVLPKPHKPSSPPKPSSSAPNPFAFWAYFCLAVSLITILFVFFSSFKTQDPKAWFLSLPNDLRQHYSRGRTIKVQTASNQSPIEVFTIEDGPKMAENVVIVHGLGCSSYAFREIVKYLGSRGIRAVALDLPGSGFSDKSVIVEGESWGGILGRFCDLYSDIREKGLFWGFDNLIEHGHLPYEENRIRVSGRKKVQTIELGSQEMGILLGQVIDSMGLAPVHLILHDSAFGLTANWVSENLGSVRSVTLIDSAPRVTALPSWFLGVPAVREFVLGFSVVYAKFLHICCSKSTSALVADAHRVLLKGRDGRRAIVGMGKKLNYSFDVAEWGGLDGVKGMPMQILWAGSWSKDWSEEGRRVADALPQANFVTHSGGRWPEEEVADELAENILRFVSSLPKSVRQVEEEPLPEHIQKMFEEAAAGGDHHHHHHGHGGHSHHDGHAHDHAAGYMDAYGLGHGWGG